MYFHIYSCYSSIILPKQASKIISSSQALATLNLSFTPCFTTHLKIKMWLAGNLLVLCHCLHKKVWEHPQRVQGTTHCSHPHLQPSIVFGILNLKAWNWTAHGPHTFHAISIDLSIFFILSSACNSTANTLLWPTPALRLNKNVSSLRTPFPNLLTAGRSRLYSHDEFVNF